MNALTWTAIALAVLLVPVGDPLTERVRTLSVRGRLHLPGSHSRRTHLHGLDWSAVPAPLAGALALTVVTVRAGPVLGLTAGLVTAVIARMLRSAARARAEERSSARLIAAVRTLGAELAAGAQPDVALCAAGEVDAWRAPLFLAAADALRTGADLHPVLADDPDLARIARAWTLARTTGAPLGALLAHVLADLVARREQRRVVAEALAGPRSSALVLAVLPVLGILLGLTMDADPLGFLVGRPAGQLVCLTGVALDVCGLAWTRRLAARAALP